MYFGNTAADAAAIGFDDSFIYEQLEIPIAGRAIPFLPMMRDEALAAFQEWDRKPDKIRY